MTLITIGKEFTFDAAHWLPNVPDGHKCKNMHGHTYRVLLEVRGQIDRHAGWVADFGDVKEAWKPVEKMLDHRVLNDIGGSLTNPTAEHLVMWIFVEFGERFAKQLATSNNFLQRPFNRHTDLSVTVYETPTSWARYGGA